MASKLPKTYNKLVATKKTTKFREAVEKKEAPLPTPGPQEVLVKNRYVGINASDINYTAGRYDPNIKAPFDVGFEGLGEVVAVGEGAKLKVGQCVGYMSYGAFSEYKIIQAQLAVPMPGINKDFITFMVSGTTATISLDKVGEIKKGETVLVTAAAGGTGQFAVQWAKLAGCHVIGTCSSEEKVQLLKSLGCDRPVNYKKESLSDVLTKEYPKGVDVVFESVGGEMFITAAKNLAKKGRLIIIGMITSYESESGLLASSSIASDLQAVPRLLLKQSASIRGFFMPDYRPDVPSYIMKLAELYKAGKIKCVTDQGQSVAGKPLQGIDDIIKGVEYLFSGKSQGKVVVEVNPPS